jgi:predicted phosphodiesterase
MKYMIFGDIHGQDLTRLEKSLLDENPDSLICLGDFDQIKSIRQFIDIEKTLLNNGKQVIKVPGNHDYALLHNQPISSGLLNSKGKSIYYLHDELSRDKEAHEYISKLVNSDFAVKGFFDKDKFDEKYPFVVVHGGYTGDMSSYWDCPEKEKPLWNRMISDEDFKQNLKELKKRGEKVMIRGHDHIPMYTTINSDKADITPTVDGQTYILSPDKEHIINPGAFFHRYFATIDTSKETPILKYHRSL